MSIDPRELRIGNFLKCKDDKAHGEVLEICYIGKGGNATINGWSYKDWSPIPLTPELLLKCGFERQVFHAFTFIDKEAGDFTLRLLIQGSCNTFQLVGNGGHDEQGEMDISHCKYLHQLQNLYFALTGNELTITL